MSSRIATLSMPLAQVHLDPEQTLRNQPHPEKDGLLRTSIRRRGILEAIHVSPTNGLDGSYLIIDGERRFAIAQELGFDRLVCVVHPYLSRESREDLRVELKSTVASLQ